VAFGGLAVKLVVHGDENLGRVVATETREARDSNACNTHTHTTHPKTWNIGEKEGANKKENGWEGIRGV
jgi:hypothetical protein